MGDSNSRNEMTIFNLQMSRKHKKNKKEKRQKEIYEGNEFKMNTELKEGNDSALNTTNRVFDQQTA